MFVKITTILILASLSGGNGDCTADNKQQQLIKCYDEYLAKLEHYDGTINSYEDYQISVSYYMENWTKIAVLCEEFNALSTCIINAKAENCMNKNDFQGVDTVWNSNSTFYATNYHTMKFMCGKGMAALNASYECLHLFRYNSVQCRIKSDDCSIRENEISCFSAAANTSCGNNAQFFIKNMLKIYLCHTHPECKNCKTSDVFFLSVNKILLIISFAISLLKYKVL